MVKTSAIVILLVILDQLSKQLIFNSDFYFNVNSGISFGLLKGVPSYLLTFLSVIILLIMLIYYVQSDRERWTIVTFSLIFAGGLANLIDRLRFGGAFDFIVIGSLPVFNPADVMISGGVLVFLVRELKKYRRAKKTL